MLRIYNTLSRSIEDFQSINPNFVGMYSCGPTVYDYQHIGHMRRYTMDDIFVRVLKANGYEVKHVMNITDVGHLVSDEDTGEDKMEKGAKKYGKNVWELAKMFEEQFKDSCYALGIQLPKDLMHATDYIQEQIDLIKTLEEKGYTYRIEDGIYFDTAKFPDYFKLSRQNPEELKKGARVEFVEGKKNAADFALWKFSYTSEGLPRRQMEWWFEGSLEGQLATEENWLKADTKFRQTVGFPGWHIECSAMSMKALGHHFDIHTGGIDHINVHHSNEIAQSECATGEKFVNYWVHHNFLIVEGEKMSKSLGNFFTVQDVIDKGYDPLALRYLYLQTHYRQEMNFTWEALDAAEKALEALSDRAIVFGAYRQTTSQDRDPSPAIQATLEEFKNALNDDLNTSKALGILHKALGLLPKTTSIEENDFDTLFLLEETDKYLGLNFKEKGRQKYIDEKIDPSDEVWELVREREAFRKAGDFGASDELREKIADLGWTIEDTPSGPNVKKS